MSKIKKDYEQSRWNKFFQWLNGEIPVEYKSSPEWHMTDEELHEKYEEDMKRAEDVHKKEARLYAKYKNWPEEKGVRIYERIYRLSAVVICLAVIGSLLITVSYLPKFGEASNPVNNEVSQRYIEKGIEETGAVNIVTGMILDYRAFDTFGESHVLFIAVSCVFMILHSGIGKEKNIEDEKAKEAENDRMLEPKNDKILQKVAFFLVPILFIFGIYIILFGHLSPGGGFSGGAIIGAGLILYLDAYGFQKTEQFFTLKTFRVISLSGLLTYAAAKSYSFFTGANHMKSMISLGTPGNILSSGLILVLNICVGAVVACTMYACYVLFRKGDF
ncbi:MAG: hydrogen gas-evolving membrane-bound hydrogenase subunit E [Lachnospiraceae bacterium]|nr:hydrogen gas-evolving membrane-bound hydrogenase subunit E [Lachnospiraceae bacterium]